MCELNSYTVYSTAHICATFVHSYQINFCFPLHEYTHTKPMFSDQIGPSLLPPPRAEQFSCCLCLCL